MPRSQNRVAVTVSATLDQWEAVADLALRGTSFSEEQMAQAAGFTKDEWREFYHHLRDAGLLVPRGNGPKAGYRPADWFLESLQARPWRQASQDDGGIF